ncbi:MAG: flagellar biosynthetic protein FliO [bacterium]|nr:flagellar biosynthetic protein FliO [bacterium]
MNIASLLNQSNKDPKTILRIVISVSVGLLVLWIFLVSKMDLPTQKNTVLVSAQDSVQQQTKSIKSALLNESNQEVSRESTTKQEQGSEVAESEQPAMFQNAFTTFLVMITLLGGLWAWSNKKKKKTDVKESDINELSQHIIGQGVQMKVLEINEEIWVVGVSANAINLLHRYPKNEWKSKPAKQEEELSESDFNSIYKMLGN